MIAEAWGRRRYATAFVNKLNEALVEAMETQSWLDHDSLYCFFSASNACLGRGSFGWASFTACSAAVMASALRPEATNTSESARYPSHSSGRQSTPARALASASGSL